MKIKSLTLSAVLITILACSKDQVEPAATCDEGTAYSTNVKDIIDQTCAYSGCHDGFTGGVPGDLTSYEGLERFLNDGSFVERVIDRRNNPTTGMPPNQSVYPESLQDDLSDIQLEIITCWIQNNYPE